MESEFKKRKRDMSFRRRGDGLSVLSAMNIDNGLRLVFQLLELVDAPHLPPEAKHEALLQVFTLLNELYKEATYVKDPLPPVYNRNKGRGLNTFSDEFCCRPHAPEGQTLIGIAEAFQERVWISTRRDERGCEK